MLRAQRGAIGLADAIDLVEQQARRDDVRADLAQHVAAHLELRFVGRIGRVDDEQQQRRFERLGERGAERRDEIVRQLLDEPDRVRDQHARLGLRLQRAHRGVERREELVRDQHLAAGERAHQRRLAGVGVADQRDPELIAARGPALVAVALDRLQLLFQLREAVADLAAIELEVGLAGAGPLLPPAARPTTPAGAARRISAARSPPAASPRGCAHDDGRSPRSRRCGRAPARRLRARGCGPGSARSRDRRSRTPASALPDRARSRAMSGFLSSASSKRSRAFDLRAGAIDPTTPVPPVIAASSSSRPLPSTVAAVDPVALLRHRADDLVTERLHQTAQLLEARGMRDVVDARDLDADEDRARNGRFGFHDAARRFRRAPRSCRLAIGRGDGDRADARIEDGGPSPYVLPMSEIDPQ